LVDAPWRLSHKAGGHPVATASHRLAT
jgi:hypothetical protein